MTKGILGAVGGPLVSRTARTIGVAGACALASSCGGRSDTLVGGADSGSSGWTGNRSGGVFGIDGGSDAGPFSSVPANWACLQQSIPAAPTGNVVLELLLTGGGGVPGGTGGTPIPGARVQACNALDVGCQYPRSQTDNLVSGTALIFNVPSGNLTVTASFAATGQAIRTVSALAREGWVTYVDIRPDQAIHQSIPL